MNSKPILVILPCHNEEESISNTIRETYACIPNAVIWVIDNVSTDSTAIKAQELGARVIFEPNKGKGFAVRRAFSLISPNEFSAIFMTDGDDTYSLDNFESALRLILENGIDMVVGTRTVFDDESLDRKRAFRKGHVFGNSLLTGAHSYLFGIEIEDTLSGWRLMTPGFCKSFFGGAGGFEIESELNAHCFTLKCKTASIPVMYRGRAYGSSSKLNTYSDGIRILRRLLRLFRSERPLLAYSLLALPWLTGSLVLVKNVLESYFRLGLVPNFPSLIAGVGGITIAALLWVTGMILENVRLQRVQAARYMYSSTSNKH